MSGTFAPALLDLEAAIAKSSFFFSQKRINPTRYPHPLPMHKEYVQHSSVSFGVLKCLHDCTLLQIVL